MAGEAAISVWELKGGLGAPAAARRAVLDALGGIVDDDLLAVVVLLTSEIVANAVVRSGAGAVLTLEVNVETIVVTVADERPDAPAVNGLAHALIEDHGLAWGAHVHQSGKAVWFAVPLLAESSGVGDGGGAGTVHA